MNKKADKECELLYVLMINRIASKVFCKTAVENPHQTGVANADDGLVQVSVDTFDANIDPKMVKYSHTYW